MPQLTFQSLLREFEQREPRLELLKAILAVQGFSPPIEASHGDVLSRMAMETAESSRGPAPVSGMGMSWKKPLPKGRDFVLCFIATGTPDPESFSAVDRVDYKEIFESLPQPPVTKFQIVIMPDDMESIDGSSLVMAVTAFVEFDDFMDDITKSSSDPRQAKDVVKHLEIRLPRLVNLEPLVKTFQAITRRDTKAAFEQIEEMGGGDEFQQDFRNYIENQTTLRFVRRLGLSAGIASTVIGGMDALTAFRAGRVGHGIVDTSVAVTSAAIVVYCAFSAAKPEATRRVVNNLIDRSIKLFRRGIKPPTAKCE